MTNQLLASPRDATGRDITWHDAAALDGYVRRVSAAAVRRSDGALGSLTCARAHGGNNGLSTALARPQERLAACNRQLKQWHRALCGRVAALAATDLLRHKER